jgi:hypothetical protein
MVEGDEVGWGCSADASVGEFDEAFGGGDADAAVGGRGKGDRAVRHVNVP